jgi:AraC-like DNA-binding protein
MGEYAGGRRASLAPADEARFVRSLVKFSFSFAKEEAFARNLGYSLTQLRRLCLLAAGEPVGSFAKRLRLERAAGRLLQDKEDLSRIAVEAGYLSWESFSKAFHCHFECAPSKFRSLNRSTSNRQPGYLLSVGQTSELPRAVRFSLSEDHSVSFLYDGPIFLARVLPNGAVDWLPRRRKLVTYF